MARGLHLNKGVILASHGDGRILTSFMKNLNHTPKASKVTSPSSAQKLANLTFLIYPLSPPDFWHFTSTRLHLNRMLPFWYRAIDTKTQHSGLAAACMGPAGGQVRPLSSSRRAPMPSPPVPPPPRVTGYAAGPPSLPRLITKLSLQSPRGGGPQRTFTSVT